MLLLLQFIFKKMFLLKKKRVIQYIIACNKSTSFTNKLYKG